MIRYIVRYKKQTAHGMVATSKEFVRESVARKCARENNGSLHMYNTENPMVETGILW